MPHNEQQQPAEPQQMDLFGELRNLLATPSQRAPIVPEMNPVQKVALAIGRAFTNRPESRAMFDAQLAQQMQRPQIEAAASEQERKARIGELSGLIDISEKQAKGRREEREAERADTYLGIAETQESRAAAKAVAEAEQQAQEDAAALGYVDSNFSLLPDSDKAIRKQIENMQAFGSPGLSDLASNLDTLHKLHAADLAQVYGAGFATAGDVKRLEASKAALNAARTDAAKQYEMARRQRDALQTRRDIVDRILPQRWAPSELETIQKTKNSYQEASFLKQKYAEITQKYGEAPTGPSLKNFMSTGIPADMRIMLLPDGTKEWLTLVTQYEMPIRKFYIGSGQTGVELDKSYAGFSSILADEKFLMDQLNNWQQKDIRTYNGTLSVGAAAGKDASRFGPIESPWDPTLGTPSSYTPAQELWKNANPLWGDVTDQLTETP